MEQETKFPLSWAKTILIKSVAHARLHTAVILNKYILLTY